jgi:hypothetical protein
VPVQQEQHVFTNTHESETAINESRLLEQSALLQPLLHVVSERHERFLHIHAVLGRLELSGEKMGGGGEYKKFLENLIHKMLKVLGRSGREGSVRSQRT